MVQLKKSYRNLGIKTLPIIFIFICILLTTRVFKIEHISIDGVERVAAKKLKNILVPLNGKNIFNLKEEETFKELSELIWVDKVRIQKVYPNTLKIFITEIAPKFILNTNRGFWILDANGKMIKEVEQENIDDLTLIKMDNEYIENSDIFHIASHIQNHFKHNPKSYQLQYLEYKGVLGWELGLKNLKDQKVNFKIGLMENSVNNNSVIAKKTWFSEQLKSAMHVVTNKDFTKSFEKGKSEFEVYSLLVQTPKGPWYIKKLEG